MPYLRFLTPFWRFSCYPFNVLWCRIAHGVDTILGPGANIKRTPRCGRNFEYFSEDPVHTGEMAAAYINGVQSLGVGTCLKHYALNNQEQDRIEVSVEVDLRVMREIYLRGFEIAVQKSNPYSMMCSYNKVHSIWASENKYLLSDILKKDWGYDGCMLSDWGAVRNSARSIAAGLDLQILNPKPNFIVKCSGILCLILPMSKARLWDISLICFQFQRLMHLNNY